MINTFSLFLAEQNRGNFLETLPSGGDRYKMRRKSDCGFIGLQQLQQLQHEQQQQQQHHQQQQLQHQQGRPRRNRSLDRSNDRLHGKIIGFG